MAFNILSYQGKKQSSVIAMQLCGGALFAINYLLLGAAVGGLLNVIATVRAIVFLFKDKLKADSVIWFVVFIASYISVYLCSFLFFDKEPSFKNLIIELLPVIGMTALNIGFRRNRAANIRRFALISSPAWLIYNITAGSIGAIACEVITLFSILIGICRHDINQKKS